MLNTGYPRKSWTIFNTTDMSAEMIAATTGKRREPTDHVYRTSFVLSLSLSLYNRISCHANRQG